MATRQAKSKRRAKKGGKGKAGGRNAKPRRKKRGLQVAPELQKLTDEQRQAKEDADRARAEEEQRKAAQLANENEQAHESIINDYIAKFVDGAELANIQTMEDVEDDDDEEEKPKPRHQLTSFLEVLLEPERNKQNLHRILTDQFLDNPEEFESLITQDEMDWNDTDYGALDFDEWDLDDNEVQRLINEWRRNVLDPVMATYMDRTLPWCPPVPTAVEFDDYEADSEEAEDEKEDGEEEGHSEEEKTDTIDTDKKKKKSKKEDKKIKKEKEKKVKEKAKSKKEEKKQKKQKEKEKKQKEKEKKKKEKKKKPETDSETEDEKEEEVHGTTTEEEDEDVDPSSSSSSSTSTEDTEDEEDKTDEDEADEEEEEAEDSDKSSADSDDIDWSTLTKDEAIEMDEEYRYGKRIQVGDYPQHVLLNIPSRFFAVHKTWDEQSHMQPVPWKRIFYHYKEDPIELPQDIEAKTINKEGECTWGVIKWAEIPGKAKKKKDTDEEEDKEAKEDEEEEEEEEEEEIEDNRPAVDRYLQEMPDDYDDIVDCNLEVRCEPIYQLRERAIAASKKGELGDMMASYVNHFHVPPLPKNLQSNTYQQPRFVCDFKNMKKHFEYGLINDEMEFRMKQDHEDHDDDMTNDIAWASWYTYRVRIWSKMTDKEFYEVNKGEEEEEEEEDDSSSEEEEDTTTEEEDEDDEDEDESESSSESDITTDSESDSNSDSDDDDDAAEKAAAKKEAKRLAKEARKEEKRVAKAEKGRIKEEKAEQKRQKQVLRDMRREAREAKAEEKRKKKEAKMRKSGKQNGRFYTSKLSSDDPIGYKLVCDHFVVQNDHCFGRPTRFYWDIEVHVDYDGDLDHRFGDFLYEELQERNWEWPNHDHPLYVHPGMNVLQDEEDDPHKALFCNGLAFRVGKDLPYDLVSIDVRVPPVSQLYCITKNKVWEKHWGECSYSPYKVWKHAGRYKQSVFVYDDPMEPGIDSLEEAFADYETFLRLDEYLGYECYAFYFNNDWMLLFGEPDPKLGEIDSGNLQTQGWTGAMMNMHDSEHNHGKQNDEWCITLGFTHPRPFNQPGVLLYKNNSFEIRVRCDYDYLNPLETHKNGYMYKQEFLEVFLVYVTRGGKREKVLSLPIRQRFDEDYVFDRAGQMVVTGDETCHSHVFIMTKNANGLISIWLDGIKVLQRQFMSRCSTHVLQKSRVENDRGLPFQVQVGHKRRGDDAQGKPTDFFNGFIYDVGIFPYCPEEYEINLMYRSMKVDHDLHMRAFWDRQRKKYKEENANLNFKGVDDWFDDE
eukprot:163873_1